MREITIKLYKNYATLKLSLILSNIGLFLFIFAVIYDETNNIFYSFIPLPSLIIISIIIAIIYRIKTKAYYQMNNNGIKVDDSKVIDMSECKEIHINYHNNRLNVFKIAIFKYEYKENNYLFLPISEIKKVGRFYNLGIKKIYENGFIIFARNLKALIKEEYKATILIVLGIILPIIAITFNKYYNDYLYIKIGLSIIFFIFSLYQINYLFENGYPTISNKEVIKRNLSIFIFLIVFVGIIFGLICLFKMAFSHEAFNINYLFYALYLTPASLLITILIIFVLGCMGYSG